MNLLISIFFFGLGAIFGSFANVLIYRLPRGISIISPSSFCPRCNKPIPYYYNIPILSFLILKGKCPFCSAPIPWRYPTVELISAILFLIIFLKWGFSLILLKFIILFFILLSISFIDIEHQAIPDALTLPGIGAGLVLNIFTGNFIPGLIGGVIGASFILLIKISGKLIFRREAMGEGDIFLLCMIGFYTNWVQVILIFFVGAFLGGVFAILLIILKKKKDYLPFAPFLSLATLIGHFYAKNIISYLFLV